MLRHIYRHIVRAPGKSLLIFAVALVFTFTMGVLQNEISNIRAEIDRLYEETVVAVELRLEGDFGRTSRVLGDFVPTAVIRDILSLDVTGDMYLEGTGVAFVVSSADEPLNYSDLDILVGVDELRRLTADVDGFVGREDFFNMHVEFADSFGDVDFAFATSHNVPIIISRELAQKRGLSSGDNAYIVHYQPVLFREGKWSVATATVIGVHDGGGLHSTVRGGAVVPLDAMWDMFGDFVGFRVARFAIDSSLNRELETIREDIDFYLQWFRYPWREDLAADMWDQELRFGVAPLAQHVALLRMLLPIMVGISLVIGAALAVLSMLQNAKNAAIMRVLGMPKLKTQISLWVGQVVLCVGGGAVGLLFTVVIGLRSGFAVVLLPYFVGAVVGTVVGVFMVTNRSPLEMLQVRE